MKSLFFFVLTQQTKHVPFIFKWSENLPGVLDKLSIHRSKYWQREMCHWKNRQPNDYHVSVVSGKRCKRSKCVDTDDFIPTSSQLYSEYQLFKAHRASNAAQESLFVHEKKKNIPGPGESIPASNCNVTALKGPRRNKQLGKGPFLNCFPHEVHLDSSFFGSYDWVPQFSSIPSPTSFQKTAGKPIKSDHIDICVVLRKSSISVLI